MSATKERIFDDIRAFGGKLYGMNYNEGWPSIAVGCRFPDETAIVSDPVQLTGTMNSEMATHKAMIQVHSILREGIEGWVRGRDVHPATDDEIDELEDGDAL